MSGYIPEKQKTTDRSVLIKTAREALAALNVEEQKALFAECGLLEHYGFVKHMTSPAAQLGALLGGVLGGAMDKSTKNDPRVQNAITLAAKVSAASGPMDLSLGKTKCKTCGGRGVVEVMMTLDKEPCPDCAAKTRL